MDGPNIIPGVLKLVRGRRARRRKAWRDEVILALKTGAGGLWKAGKRRKRRTPFRKKHGPAENLILAH